MYVIFCAFHSVRCMVLSCQFLFLYNIRKTILMDRDRISNFKLRIFCGVFLFLIFIQSLVKLILEDCLLLCNKFLREKLSVLSKPR